MRTPVKVALLSIALLDPLCLLADRNLPQNTRPLEARADSLDTTQNEIQFRLLSEADFRARHPPPNPPPEMPWHSAGLNALSCVRVGWPDLRIEFSMRGDAALRRRISATVFNPRFVALFDRECSWWSPKPKDRAYALMHEQVHFAIVEYAARGPRLRPEPRRRSGRTHAKSAGARRSSHAFREARARGVRLGNSPRSIIHRPAEMGSPIRSASRYDAFGPLSVRPDPPMFALPR